MIDFKNLPGAAEASAIWHIFQKSNELLDILNLIQ